MLQLSPLPFKFENIPHFGTESEVSPPPTLEIFVNKHYGSLLIVLRNQANFKSIVANVFE